MTTIKRKKPDTLYLLKSEKYNIYKYGCTSNLLNRIKSINITNNHNCKFIVLASFKVDNKKHTFQKETLFKWFLWGNHIGITEFFKIEDTNLTEDLLISKMRDIARK